MQATIELNAKFICFPQAKDKFRREQYFWSDDVVHERERRYAEPPD